MFSICKRAVFIQILLLFFLVQSFASSRTVDQIFVVTEIVEIAANPHVPGIPEPVQPLVIKLGKRLVALDTELRRGTPGTVTWKTGPTSLDLNFYRKGSTYLMFVTKSDPYRWKNSYGTEFVVRWRLLRAYKL